MSGRRNRIAQTVDEVGLPGRPNTLMSPRRPWISGLPGRMAMRQKSSVMPASVNACCTRSWSPTEAPPSVTNTSARWACASAKRAASAAGVVGDDAKVDRLAARRCNNAGDGEGVGGDDLRRAPRRARKHEFITGRENGDARAPRDGKLRMIGGCGECDIAGREAPPPGQQRLALGEVEASRADMGARRD